MLSAYIEIFSMKTYMGFNEQNKLMNKIKPEAWIHGPDQRSQKGKGWEGLEEISQRTYSYMIYAQPRNAEDNVVKAGWSAGGRGQRWRGSRKHL